MQDLGSRPRLTKIVVGVLATIVSLAAFMPSASADWSTSESLAGAGDQISYMSVQYDGAGRGYLFYLKSLGGGTMQVVMRERAAGGGPWGPLQPLSLSPAPGPNGLDAAVNSNGDVVIAYNIGGQIEVTRRPAGGSFTAPVGYSSPGTSGPNQGFGLIPSVDLSDNGTAIVAWSAYNSCCGNVSQWRVLGAVYRPGIGWDAAAQVWDSSESSIDVHSYPSATVDVNGNGFVAYGARNSANQDELWTVDFTSGTWASPVLRSSVGFGNNITVDADSRGTTSAIVWNRGLYVNAISRTDGVWSPTSILSFNQSGSAPFVAVGATDTVYAVYTEQGGNAGMFLGSRPAAGSFTTERLSAGSAQSVAANALGDVAVGWSQYNNPGIYAYMMLKPAGGSFPATPTQLTTTYGVNGGAAYSSMAVDLWGHALAAATPSANGYPSEIFASIETRDAAGEPETTGPSISPGFAEVGDVVTCSPGTFAGTPPFSYAYEWLKDGLVISGEAASAYTVRDGDEGGGVSCHVTATNDAGTADATSDELFIDYTAPQNLTVPTVTGTVEAGETLTCHQGDWSGHPAPDLTIEWMRNGVAIPDEEADTYDIQLSDQGTTLACRVTATNDGGQDVAASTAKTVPAVVNPTNSKAPNITGLAKPAIGTVLTCNKGTWAGKPTPQFAYYWLRDGATVGYGNTYAVVAGDAASTLTCQVSGENIGGELTVASSNNRIVEPPPVNNSLPVVSKASGSTWAVGGTASCAKGSWSYAQTYGYEWFRDATPVGTGVNTYPLTLADAGHNIVCRVTATGRMGTGQATSVGKALPPAPQATVAPSVTGTAKVGKTLTCARGTWTNATSYTFSWQRNGSPVGGTTNKYVVVAADLGTTISCVVQATGPGGTNNAAAPGRLIT